MATNDIRRLFILGLRAVHAADEQGRVTAGDIAGAATDPRLKQALTEGSRIAQGLGRQIGEVFRMAGEAPSHLKSDAIEGIATDAQRTREAMHDPQGRDLGIIAQSQIALHYYIATYGTLGAYAQALGMGQAASALHAMVGEVKAQDERFTRLAAEILG